jgi:predicted DNA-binding transcriptional regulator AlpA
MQSHGRKTQRDELACAQSTMSKNQNPETGAGLPPAPDYENKKQLAARLGVSVRTIDNLLTRGPPHLKLTRKLTRFPRAVVNEWLAERQVRRA